METTDYCFSFFRKPIQNIEPIRAVGIVDVYRYIIGHYAQPQTEALRLMLSSSEAKRYKATHFDYCTFSGLFRKRNEKELIMHSGLMCLDFDHVDNIGELKQQLLNHEYFDTELLFVSPSGNGLKWLVHASYPTTHKHILTINTKMMSKKIFSAQDWENVPSEIQQAHTPSIVPIYNKVEEDVESVVREIEQRSIDIAPNYKDWVELGFALVDGLGENGREYYHRISRFYPIYQREETDQQYTHCLHSKGQGITIRSFFHLANQAGISLAPFSKEYLSILPNIQNGKTGKWIKSEEELPVFPECVFEHLPPFLNEVVNNSISVDDRDTILIGAIVCLSVCFHNVCGVYDERIVYPNLYLFVVADAGMGKGALTLCRELVAPINRNLHELSKRMEQEYKEAMSAYIKGKKTDEMTMPTEPPMRMLVIPANSSASSFLKILGDNDGIGLLFESEGDTLSQTLKSDYGNYSDVLRKAFHHELVSLSRRKDREYCEVANPRVSVALAGTPEQVRRLIPDAENGLMSRFCFYIIRFKRGIRNVFATSDISQSKNAMFKLLGDKFCHLHENFVRQGNYSFSLPSDLQEHFIEYLSRVNEECCDEVDNKMQGVVRRMGLIAYRIMMVLTAVRHLDNVIHKSSSDETVQLVCHEFDYSIAMSICDTLLYHAVFIYQNLSGNQSKRFNAASQETGVYARRNTLYNMLPDTFTKKDYDAVVLTLGENGSTANKWIEAFIKDGKLCRIEQGKYRKIF